MPQGTIKWYNPTKDYGFIEQEPGTEDIFIHGSDLLEKTQNSLQKGQIVEFEISQGVLGPMANQVRLV